jgi:putative tryptophan/tyrosine transport system substrate-binding protein
MIELTPINAPDVSEIERGIAAFARPPTAGWWWQWAELHFIAEIVAVAAKHRLPAVYPFRYFVSGGGLISYGADTIDQYRRAADYIDRIFKGEKPADLPVQTPTKYNLVINFKTARSLGLAVPHAMLTRADEVIE